MKKVWKCPYCQSLNSVRRDYFCRQCGGPPNEGIIEPKLVDLPNFGEAIIKGITPPKRPPSKDTLLETLKSTIFFSAAMFSIIVGPILILALHLRGELWQAWATTAVEMVTLLICLSLLKW